MFLFFSARYFFVWSKALPGDKCWQGIKKDGITA
jgi:hypothetical protein